MPKPMTLKVFNRLGKLDFDNGAVLDEIAEALKQRELLLGALKEMDALVENLWGAVEWGRTFGLDIERLNAAPLNAKRMIAMAEGETG